MTFIASDHTFVVCAYQSNPFLSETIDSLFAQTVKSKIVLSTSTPNKYLEEICSSYNIEMFVNSNPHLAGDDWNYGYDRANSSLVTIAHQDDYYAPRFLEKTLDALSRVDDVLISFSDYFEIRAGERIDDNSLLRIKRVMNAPFCLNNLNNKKWVKRRLLSFGCSICCPAVTFVKENVGPHPFDTFYKNSCDYKTWVDLASRSGRFVYIPERLLGHRIYGESATSRNLSDNIRKSEDQEILSNLWPKPIARAINAAYSLSEKSNEM